MTDRRKRGRPCGRDRRIYEAFETGFRAIAEMSWDMGAEPYWGA